MTGEDSKINFVEEFYSRELHSVLEKILLVLPLPALLSCLKVNKRWEDIVRFYNNSKNSRIRQILDERKSLEWRKKKPRIFTLTFEEFNIFEIYCLHIIGDERETAIAAFINQTEKARIIVIDTQAVQVLNILEVVNDAGQEIDVLNIKLNMNEEFLVAMAVLKFDSEVHLYLCCYFIWDKQDYSKKPYIVKSSRPQERLYFSPVISYLLLDIPVISVDGNLLIDETSRWTSKPESTFEELNLRTKSRRTKVAKNSPSTTINYRHKNAMISQSLEKESEILRKALRNEIVTYFTPLSFFINERFSLQKKFSKRAYIIGLSENYVAVSTPFSFTTEKVTVYRLIDGQTVLEFALGTPKATQVSQYRDLLRKQKSEMEVQFSRNHVACKGLVIGKETFDLYILDFATGKVLLECKQDLEMNVKKFLFLEDLLILEQGNKIVFTKFWL